MTKNLYNKKEAILSARSQTVICVHDLKISTLFFISVYIAILKRINYKSKREVINIRLEKKVKSVNCVAT